MALPLQLNHKSGLRELNTIHNISQYWGDSTKMIQSQQKIGRLSCCHLIRAKAEMLCQSLEASKTCHNNLLVWTSLYRFWSTVLKPLLCSILNSIVCCEKQISDKLTTALEWCDGRKMKKVSHPRYDYSTWQRNSKSSVPSSKSSTLYRAPCNQSVIIDQGFLHASLQNDGDNM